jgi:hypothetical protein
MLVVILSATLLIPAQANASHAVAVPTNQQTQGHGVGPSSGAGPTRRSFVGTVRKVAKCAIHIGGFVVGNAVAINKLRRAGGVWKLARETWKAKGREGKLKVLSSVFGELIGLNAVVEACGA